MSDDKKINILIEIDEVVVILVVYKFIRELRVLRNKDEKLTF